MEISQISGIVQNVSMLIKVVMRIVVAVGGKREEKREKEQNCVTGPKKTPSGLDPLYQIQMFLNGEIQCNASSTRKNVSFASKAPPHTLTHPCRSSCYFWQTTKKVSFDLPLYVGSKSVTGCGM